MEMATKQVDERLNIASSRPSTVLAEPSCTPMRNGYGYADYTLTDCMYSIRVYGTDRQLTWIILRQSEDILIIISSVEYQLPL